MNGEELDRELKKLEEKKIQTHAAIVSGKEKNLKAVRIIRRDIAQILTLRNIIKAEQK